MLKLMDNIAKNMRSIIALSVVYLAFAFLFSLLFVKIPPENKDIVNIATGAVIVAGITGVITYYFGSSKDKSDQDKATIAKDIANIVK